jgi:hypothetical protein
LQVLAGLDSSDTRLVKALMHGSANPAEDYPSAPWLFDIVSAVFLYRLLLSVAQSWLIYASLTIAALGLEDKFAASNCCV